VPEGDDRSLSTLLVEQVRAGFGWEATEVVALLGAAAWYSSAQQCSKQLIGRDTIICGLYIIYIIPNNNPQPPLPPPLYPQVEFADVIILNKSDTLAARAPEVRTRK
jgi:hypothetical protein